MRFHIIPVSLQPQRPHKSLNFHNCLRTTASTASQVPLMLIVSLSLSLFLQDVKYVVQEDFDALTVPTPRRPDERWTRNHEDPDETALVLIVFWG